MKRKIQNDFLEPIIEKRKQREEDAEANLNLKTYQIAKELQFIEAKRAKAENRAMQVDLTKQSWKEAFWETFHKLKIESFNISDEEEVKYEDLQFGNFHRQKEMQEVIDEEEVPLDDEVERMGKS